MPARTATTAPLDLALRPHGEQVLGTLLVLPWHDPVLDAIGHDPRSPYVERFWLGILGPTTTFLLRHVAEHFDTQPDGFELDLDVLASRLGLAGSNGRQGPFSRSLQRTVQFGLAHPHSHGLSVRRHLPPLAHRQLLRLHPALQAEHQRWEREHTAPEAA